MSSPRTASLAADPRVRRGLSAQLEKRRRWLEAGESSLGWKVGFGSRESMGRLGIEAPLVGFLTSRSRIDSGATVSLAGWSNPVVEPEIAIHLAASLEADRGVAAAERAIGGVGPALELADADPALEDVETILAGNVFQRHVVVGPASRPHDFTHLVGRIRCSRRGQQVVDDPQALTGDIVGLLHHVARLLAEFGVALRSGEIVICGSIVPPIAVAARDSIGYRLDPLAEIEIRFEH
jgi:2-keto-4-pentenoate hydratase